MSDVQDMRMIKGTGQSLTELTESIVLTAVVYYIVRPDKKEQHLAILRTHVNRVKHWYSVKSTVTSIRNLPETKSQ